MSSPGEETAARPSAEETVVEGARVRSGLSLGAVVDRYVVLEEVGRGAVGVVYAAYDPRLDRRIALKVLERGGTTEPARARMQREAQALARLAHANVVTVFDVVFTDAHVCIAMEYLDGAPLDAWLGQHPRSWREILAAFIAAGRGLAAAHAAGIVHRDFKPSNVVVTADGRVKVTDFGLARGTTTLEVAATPIPEDASLVDAHLTAPGSIVGTAAYMAAEQFKTGAGSPAADQFSFCVSLYRGLFDAAPFPGNAPLEILQNVSKSDPRPPPGGSRVPRRVQQAVLRGLARNPEERHPSMDALIEVLESATRTRGGRLVVAGVAAASSAGALAFAMYSGPDPCADVAAPMAEVWDEARQAEVTRALAAIDVPYADDAAATVSERLDAYASAWTDERTGACREAHEGVKAAAVPPDQRIACLERGREHVAAIVDVLREADEAVAATAVMLVDTAEDPRRCSEPRSQEGADDPYVRSWAELEQVRSQIARGRARAAADHTAEATTILEQALEDARDLRSPLLETEAQIHLGATYADAGDHARAVAVLEDGLARAIAIGSEHLAAEAVSRLLMFDGQSLDRIERGRVWEVQARGYLERFADDPRMRSQLANSLAMFESQDGRYLEAIARMAGLEDDMSETPTRRFTWLLNFGAVYLKAEQHEKGAAVLQRAVTLAREVFGEGHPTLATAQSRLATELSMVGRTDEAIELHREALAVRRRHGPAVAVAESLSDLGIVLVTAGDLDRAIEVTQEARDLLLREAPEHGYLASAQHNLGELYSYAGRNEEALVEISRALKVRRKHGHEGEALLGPLAALARTHSAMGNAAEALATIAEAEECMRSLPPHHVMRAKVLWVKAEILAADGRAQESFDTMVTAIDALHGAAASPSEWFGVLAKLGELAMALR